MEPFRHEESVGEEQGARFLTVPDDPTPACGLEALTRRERQVVACLALGRSTREMAFSLDIADATVRVLLARAATKLGVQGREALLAHPAVRPLRPAHHPDP
jgi:DNA-binding CsgD family transcriptional regulator